jgi:hypothetical protein
MPGDKKDCRTSGAATAAILRIVRSTPVGGKKKFSRRVLVIALAQPRDVRSCPFAVSTRLIATTGLALLAASITAIRADPRPTPGRCGAVGTAIPRHGVLGLKAPFTAPSADTLATSGDVLRKIRRLPGSGGLDRHDYSEDAQVGPRELQSRKVKSRCGADNTATRRLLISCSSLHVTLLLPRMLPKPPICRLYSIDAANPRHHGPTPPP